MKCSKCGFEFTEGIFCPECGTKNDLNEFTEEIIADDSVDEEEIVDIDKAMEDVLFYYEQSKQKKEATQSDDHLYYTRAQQLLQRMIKQKSSDYRVWWEACKPIDFWEETFSEETIEKYKVNDTYFNKALDYADISEKKQIIKERDAYQERKRNALDLIKKIKEEKREEARIKEEERRKAEEVQRQKNAEEQRKRAQIEFQKREEAKRIEQEKSEQKRLENEGKVMAMLSLIFGIISLCTFGCFFIPEILGIIFAFNGKKQGVMRGQAKAGMICSCISIVVVIGVVILG